MSSLQSTVLCLSIAYAALGVLMLTACLFTSLPWPVKAAAIVVTSAFYVLSFFATRSLLGWSSDDPLPPKFKLLSARIVEPHTRADDPGGEQLLPDDEAMGLIADHDGSGEITARGSIIRPLPWIGAPWSPARP